MTRLATRTGRYLVPGIAAALLLAACGGGGDGVTIGNPAPTATSLPAPTTPATGSPAPGAPASGATTSSAPASSATTPEQSAPSTDRCHTSELTASFGAEDAGAGQRYATLVLGNRSKRTCTIYGYGGLQPLDGAKKQLPITLTRNTSRASRLVRLAPGAQVARTIHWTAISSGPGKCPQPAYADIIPPDETDPLVVAWPFGEICGGRVDGFPYGVTV